MKFTKHIFILFLLLSFSDADQSQSLYTEIPGQTGDKNLLEVGGNIFTKDDFTRILNKKIRSNQKSITEKEVQEYLEHFIDFQLKVKEAEDLSLDKTEAFNKELAGYGNQLKGGFRKSKQNIEPLLQEAWERKKYLVRTEHILVSLNENAAPSDTLDALKKITDIRKKIISGMGFSDAAKKYSEDNSTKKNGGDLGYFTVFAMVYPFESAAYKLEKKEISQPVRTKFGYHLIKLIDKKVNPGEILVKHIMIKISDQQNTEASEQKIKDIYKKLKMGQSFDDLVKMYSEDKSSLEKNGELAWFGPGQMPVEFEKAAFDLSNYEEYSEPVQTKYGWHIIQLLNKRPPQSFEESKNALTEKITKDSRSKINSPADQGVEENPEYIALLKEYRDGILVFDITDAKVWSKAVKDTEGLKNYYENNKNKYGSDFAIAKPKVTTDYQNYLEKEWIAALRKKYTVTLNKTVYSMVLAEIK